MSDLRPGFLPVDDYLKLPRNKSTWLLKPLLPISGAALIYGAPKLGKSYLAIQLGLSLSGAANHWLGFPVEAPGRVLYLQLDTPREIWMNRFDEMVHKSGLQYNSDLLCLADRESIEHYPFDILQPSHMKYLWQTVQPHKATTVIIDTLRESHSGDEDSSTVSRNVIANLVGAVHPAALIIVSHSRKNNPEADKDLMDDARGSSYIPGRMDVIMRLTKNRLYYSGRSIEEGNIKLQRLDSGLWEPIQEFDDIVTKVLADQSLTSMRAKARALGVIIGKSEEASMSMLRRATARA